MPTNDDERYCYIAAVCLLVYEICVTMDREVRHVWRRRLSAASWIYLLNRYLVLSLYLVNLVLTLGVGGTVRMMLLLDTGVAHTRLHLLSCNVLARVSEVLMSLPYVVWAAFSGLRVYAIVTAGWHLSLLTVALSLVPVGTYIFRDIHETTVISPSSGGCFTSTTYPFELDARTCLVLSDLLVLGITWKKTFGLVRLANKQSVNTSLSVTNVLLRDGTTYFTIWTILNTMHIVGTYVEAVRYITTFTDGVTSILVSRFILNLRVAASSTSPDQHVDSLFPFDESWRPATNSEFLGPLGAPLNHSLFEDEGPRLISRRYMSNELIHDDAEMIRWKRV